jgi:integrase/recombinase XerC
VGTINSKGLLEQFEAHLTGTGLSSATVVNYLADLRAFLRWCEEASDAASSPFRLDVQDIQAFCSYLKESKKHAPATINRRLQALRKFYNLAIIQGWALTNPADDVPLLDEIASERTRSLTPEDIDSLLDAVQRGRARWVDRDWAIFQVLLGAGLKLGELTQVRLDDVHLDGDRPFLHIAGVPDEPGRNVALDEPVCDALRIYLSSRRSTEGVDHLFVNRDGNPLSTRSVQRLIRHYARTSGLDGLTTQSLRYVYARKIFQDSGDLKEVARQLGHRHLATTIRYLRPCTPQE